MTTPRSAPEITEEVREQARILWDFHVISDDLKPADFILALGSHDERVAIYAASIFLLGLAPTLVVSGGGGKVTAHEWTELEAERFAAIAKQMGVPNSHILIEPAATNTGENITRSRAALTAAAIEPKRGILVMKPYMARRALATAGKQWPEVQWLAAPPPFSFDAYPRGDVPEERMIQLLVGDLQRLWIYAGQGFQLPQMVPADVRNAYECLVRHGFDQFVLPE